MIFSDKDIPASVRNAVRLLAERRRLPQSVMLTGGTEAMREKCANELIQSVVCTAETGVPCGKCAQCLKAKAGVHPDVIRVVPESGKKTVSMKVIRDNVLDTLWVAPNEAENKVYVFPNADELSVIIQNALLKSTEEPPEFVMFVFLAERRESFLTTIISRVTEFSLGTPPVRAKKSDEMAEKICAGVLSALVSGSEYDIMMSASPMNKNRKLIKTVAVKINESVLNAMAERCGASVADEPSREVVRLAASFTEVRLLKIKNAMDKIITLSDTNANENLLISEFSALLGEI